MQHHMITIRNILCPLDLSETSEVALGYAVMLSRWYGAALTAMEVIWLGVPPVSPARASPVLTPAQVDEFSSELRQFVAATVPSGVPVATILRHGPVVSDIVQEARALPADLVVMGTHGRGGFERFILGSVAEKVLRKAPCPSSLCHRARRPRRRRRSRSRPSSARSTFHRPR